MMLYLKALVLGWPGLLFLLFWAAVAFILFLLFWVGVALIQEND